MTASAFFALQPIAKANFMPMPTPQPAIVIKSDGTVSPASAPITRMGEVYSLTDNIVSYTLAVERDNVTVDGSGHSLLGINNLAGVFVQEHSGITLRNLNISGFSYGVLFTWFSYGDTSRQRSNTVSNNKLSNNSYGIYINDFSSGDTVSENTLTNNTHGIYLGSCSNNFLRNNRMDNNTYGLFVYGASAKTAANDIDNSNTVDGKPVIYWVNQKNKEIPLDIGYLALVNCNNMTIQNLDLTHKGQGMLLVGLKDSIIVNNKIAENDNGIWLVQSQNNTIFGNIFAGNKHDALYISSSSNNRITRNNFTDNGLSGTPAAQVLDATGQAAVWLTDSSNNIISNNTIEGNGEGICLQRSQSNIIGTNYLAGNNGTAMHFYDCTLNNITSNTIISNNDWAIKLWSSNQNTVYANFLANNSWGILLDAAAENKITENMIVNSAGWAIQLKSSSDSFMSSVNNIIFHNNFINNQQSDGLDVSIPGIWTYPGGYVAGVGNIWDDGYEGNYWSDYLTRYPNATEIPGTGTGNTPFAINENNIDNHPLLNSTGSLPPPFQSPRPPSSNSTSPATTTSSPSPTHAISDLPSPSITSPTLSPSPSSPEFPTLIILATLVIACLALLVLTKRYSKTALIL
jgi:parallel beta-helix repeat protein